MTGCVWVGYSPQPPYLPIAVADTAAQLAKLMGTTKGTVYSAWSHYQAGESKTCRYHCVPMDASSEIEQCPVAVTGTHFGGGV